MKKLIIVTALTLCLATAAHAKTQPVRVCTEEDSSQDYSECLTKKVAETDKLIGEAVERLQTRHKKDGDDAYLDALNKSQASWESYRTNDCKYQNMDSIGGSAEQDYINDCLGRYGQKRVDFLKRIIDNP